MPIRVRVPEELYRLPQRIERALAIARTGAAQVIETEIRQRYREDDAVASGATVQSVRTIENRRDRVRVAADTLQAQFVELGRRAGPVPSWRVFKPILRQWASNKGLNFDDSTLWFIARKIRLRGFKGRHSVEVAAQTVADKVGRVFRAALSRL